MNDDLFLQRATTSSYLYLSLFLSPNMSLRFSTMVRLSFTAYQRCGTVTNLSPTGIYEIHMNLTGVPFLEDKMPRGTEFLQPKDIMST